MASQVEKDTLLAADPKKFFTELHSNGFPPVLVRLAATDADELGELIIDGWRCQSPPALLAEQDSPRPVRCGEGLSRPRRRRSGRAPRP